MKLTLSERLLKVWLRLKSRFVRPRFVVTAPSVCRDHPDEAEFVRVARDIEEMHSVVAWTGPLATGTWTPEDEQLLRSGRLIRMRRRKGLLPSYGLYFTEEKRNV